MIEYLSVENAEKLAGKRLDRRRKWFLWEGEVCHNAVVTVSCSGCLETGDYNSGIENYPFDKKAGCYVGGGCEECGYTGKRISSYPTPHSAYTKR